MVMIKSSLDHYIETVRPAWGQLSSELVGVCKAQLEGLLQASPAEDWLAELHQTTPASKELYRDPDHGFVLLAHTERASLYRPPHDHGRSWVIYGVQQGEIAMGTFARVENPAGQVRLVKRDETIVRPGQVQVYLPGDIHETLCLSDSALLFRFSERDLKLEDTKEHRVTRYVQENGSWTMPSP